VFEAPVEVSGAMLLSLARSSIARKCSRMAFKSTRAMSSAVVDSGNQEFDTYGWTEEELDNYLEGLGLPESNLAVLTETDDAYVLKPTNSQKEFDDHCVDFAIHNEFTDHEDNKPYFEALGLDFKKKATLATGFALTALSNEWYVMNEETLVALAFVGALVSTKALVGPMLVKWYEDYKADFVREQNEAEDAHIQGCKLILDGFPVDKIHKNLDLAFEEEKGVVELEAKARVIQQKNDLINRYKKNLDQLVVAKNEAANKEYRILLGQTLEDAREEASKKAFKKQALTYALDAAAGKATGPNPTVELFDKVFKGLSK